MSNINEIVEKILKKHKGGKPFFDALDFSIKGDLDILDVFVKDAIKYKNPNDTAGLLLTGEFGQILFDRYTNILFDKFNMIVLCSSELIDGIPKHIQIYSKSTKVLNSCGYIHCMDDSYYSGKTIKYLTKFFNLKDSDMLIHVIYDGSLILPTNYKKFTAMYRYHKN